MNLSRIPAAYWLLIGLGVVSIGLVGMLFVPKPPACVTDGTLQVRVADTVWVLPEEEAGGLTVKHKNGHVCEPPAGEITTDLLTLENVEPTNVLILIKPYRGGTKFPDQFSVRCIEAPFITVDGENLGRSCSAYKSLAGTTVRIAYYSAEWPSERWPELFHRVDRLLIERRIG
ncbi:MAG: hypothetical protein U9R70_00400 [Pseudomonadota bacterium]|nr:hypothetical protein [Pseudomonadota bacterium]